MLKACGFLVIPPLAAGVSFAQAMSYPVVFPTTVPTALSLPALGKDNIAEGIVVRAQHESALHFPGGWRLSLSLCVCVCV